VQLPYYNKKAFENVDAFLERLDPFLAWLPKKWRFGVEVRNKNWIGKPLLDVLRARGVALVLVDILYMPHPDEFDSKLDLFTADFSYARLIGDRRAIDELTTTFDKVVVNQTSRLKRWAAFLADQPARVRETFAFANNHYAGYAPATIRELARRVERAKG
jgi:uncharacterized protein YecE (DUF72 family)